MTLLPAIYAGSNILNYLRHFKKQFVIMKIIIKYMVSNPCIVIVKEELRKLGYDYVNVKLGEAEISENITNEQIEEIKFALNKFGLEVIEDKKKLLVEKVKNLIIEMVHYEEELPKIKYSYYISQKLNYNYTYLANLFSQTEGITIESFILCHKIEKAKELIVYNELTLTEIASRLDYSSIAHFSNQFKKITGLRASDFKSMKEKVRIPLEHV
ncbi:helix-turn-helix domain-containing protein [Ferruginibacter sp.]